MRARGVGQERDERVSRAGPALHVLRRARGALAVLALGAGVATSAHAQDPAPPRNDECIKATLIGCGGPFSFTGTTKFAEHQYGFQDEASSCTGHMAEGR